LFSVSGFLFRNYLITINSKTLMSMFTTPRQRLVAWAPRRVSPLLGLMFLLLSVTLIAHAMLTVSDSGLSGNANVTVDGTGALNIGTASSTGITIGRSGQAVNLPGSLLVAGNATTTGNLTVLGALSDAAGNRYATSTTGSDPWTTVSGGISGSAQECVEPRANRQLPRDLLAAER
jgi:hypothetical protein